MIHKMRRTGRFDAIGFTLIELLVVVAIIAVLVAMLLPALGEARSLAQKVVCKSQLKQIATGLTMYCGDSNGFYPHGTWANRSWAFGGIVGSGGLQGVNPLLYNGYLNDPKVFICPGAEAGAHWGVWGPPIPALKITPDWVVSADNPYKFAISSYSFWFNFAWTFTPINGPTRESILSSNHTLANDMFIDFTRDLTSAWKNHGMDLNVMFADGRVEIRKFEEFGRRSYQGSFGDYYLYPNAVQIAE